MEAASSHEPLHEPAPRRRKRLTFYASLGADFAEKRSLAKPRISQARVAKLANVSLDRVRDLENGRCENMRKSDVRRMAKAISWDVSFPTPCRLPDPRMVNIVHAAVVYEQKPRFIFRKIPD